MTKQIIATIGLNGDFKDPVVWLADMKNSYPDLVAADVQLVADQKAGQIITPVAVEFSGFNTGPNNGFTWQAAPGCGINNQPTPSSVAPLNYDPDFAAFTNSTEGDDAVRIKVSYVSVLGLQIKAPPGTQTPVPLYLDPISNILLDQLVLVNQGVSYIVGGASPTNVTLSRSLLIDAYGGNQAAIYKLGAGAKIIGNTLVTSSDALKGPTDFAAYLAEDAVFEDNAMFGFRGFNITGNILSPTFNVTDLADIGGSNNRLNVSYSTSAGALFRDITVASGDFRIQPGSAIIGAGVALIGNETDIVGTPRSSPPGAGAWEFPTTIKPKESPMNTQALKNNLFSGGQPAIVTVTGMSKANGGNAEPLAGPMTATVTDQSGNPLANGVSPPVSIALVANPDGGVITITPDPTVTGTFGVLCAAPNYADNDAVTPLLWAGQVIAAEDTLLVGEQTQ